ncbi:hypothetical protein JOD97_003072 [Duganella sp. 1411]|uniref:hypothetical protein n=1 Tax=Duganella sp. 1411 TaxID=2806572 RepID=UPI001AE4964E|nr:hypothetical protein [Duganella sp. 1411]MBP1205030.1 hypothetical protein [Duganella sp. 1411]
MAGLYREQARSARRSRHYGQMLHLRPYAFKGALAAAGLALAALLAMLFLADAPAAARIGPAAVAAAGDGDGVLVALAHADPGLRAGQRATLIVDAAGAPARQLQVTIAAVRPGADGGAQLRLRMVSGERSLGAWMLARWRQQGGQQGGQQR